MLLLSLTRGRTGGQKRSVCSRTVSSSETQTFVAQRERLAGSSDLAISNWAMMSLLAQASQSLGHRPFILSLRAGRSAAVVSSILGCGCRPTRFYSVLSATPDDGADESKACGGDPQERIFRKLAPSSPCELPLATNACGPRLQPTVGSAPELLLEQMGTAGVSLVSGA